MSFLKTRLAAHCEEGIQTRQPGSQLYISAKTGLHRYMHATSDRIFKNKATEISPVTDSFNTSPG